jgi:hypothetical protein|tara:strand:- start:476 stop:1510 length:1035 start_codon:yes stop_codon:yes gene_type:complete
MFNSKNVSHYLIAAGLILVGSSLINKVKDKYETNDEEDLIRDYLLNESPLYGKNRPKIWIHSKYEINARKWKSFQSRNTTDLNQPYLHLTIKTIINNCGNDFNVCLIDDESFSKLLPNWDVNVNNLSEPSKSKYRELGMLRLLQVYGGMVVPNSFVCSKNLKLFYEREISNGNPFVCEAINRQSDVANRSTVNNFTPSTYFMGANKNCNKINELVEHMKKVCGASHPTSENEFTGSISQKCKEMIIKQNLNLVGGERIGVKSKNHKPIVLDDLMEEAYLDLHNSNIGIYIPSDELLKRSKYQWFAILSTEELLQSRSIIIKHLLSSLSDSSNPTSNTVYSVVTI